MSRKPDIAEPGMEENVHKFASDNVDVLPSLRRDRLPAMNGSESPWQWNGFHQQARKPDIAEPGMDEEVHGFASDAVDVLPSLRRDVLPAKNGGDSPWQWNGFHQQSRRPDIAEAGMEENVHKFASDNVDVLPGLKRDLAPATNGVNSPWQWVNGASFHQTYKKKIDINEAKMDEEVHGFASDNVDVLPSLRKDNLPAMNGSGDSAFPPQNFIYSRDIANKEVRPDVWHTVNKMINPVPLWRSPEPPKPTYIPSPPAGGYAKEADAPNPSPKEVDDNVKKAKAVPEETDEEKKAKKEPVPVKKTPENEPGDLDPPKHDDYEDEDDKKAAFLGVEYDIENKLWRNMNVLAQLQ